MVYQTVEMVILFKKVKASSIEIIEEALTDYKGNILFTKRTVRLSNKSNNWHLSS